MAARRAIGYCESIGGHLVTITSAEEQNEVYNNYVKNGANNMYWIGGHRVGTTNSFAWVTGEKWEYTNWDPGEPNGDGDENCVQMFRRLGKWNDGEDNGDPRLPYYSLENTGFICEWD